MPENNFTQLWPGRSIDTTEVKLQTYLRDPIGVVVSVTVYVCVDRRQGEWSYLIW